MDVRVKTIKLLEKKLGENTCGHMLGRVLVIQYQKHKPKQKSDKMNLIIKNIRTSKYTIKKIKRDIQTMRKYMQNTYLIKDLYLKNFHNSVRQTIQLKKISKKLHQGKHTNGIKST